MNPVDEAIAMMLDFSPGFALDVAEEIRKAEGWQGDAMRALKRINQCWRGDAGRGFKSRWLTILLDRAARSGVPNLIHGPLDDAYRDADYELRREARQMRSVGPRERARHVG